MNLTHLTYIGIFLSSVLCGAQIPKEYKSEHKDSIATYYYIVQGDTIPREYIGLGCMFALKKCQTS